MQTRTNIVDFATYRFARDLRLTEARDAAARRDLFAPARTPDEALLSEEAAAHRARMLRHLAARGPGNRGPV
jgi:hypothetical protein